MQQTERTVLVAVATSLLAPKLAAVGLVLTPEQQAQLVAVGAAAGVAVYHVVAGFLARRAAAPPAPPPSSIAASATNPPAAPAPTAEVKL